MKRNDAIDIMKFLAAVLVLNCHLGEMYVSKYKILATGGAIGDALFFFCSGFTLFLSSKPLENFGNWYKRRISRIYPAVFAWAIIMSSLSISNTSMINVILHGGGWFISAIMVYYVLFYFIKKFFINSLWIPCALSVIIVVVWCIFFHDNSTFGNIYSSGKFSSRLMGFLNMLLGACLGKYSHSLRKPKNVFICLLIPLFCLVAYYGSLYLCGRCQLHRLEIISMIPLIGLMYGLYCLFSTEIVINIYNKRIIHSVIFFVGSLCLEMYICQFVLITDRFNNLFPLNVILIFPVVVMVAYLLRIVSKIFHQTFQERNYNWQEVFKI